MPLQVREVGTAVIAVLRADQPQHADAGHGWALQIAQTTAPSPSGGSAASAVDGPPPGTTRRRKAEGTRLPQITLDQRGRAAMTVATWAGVSCTIWRFSRIIRRHPSSSMIAASPRLMAVGSSRRNV